VTACCIVFSVHFNRRIDIADLVTLLNSTRVCQRALRHFCLSSCLESSIVKLKLSVSTLRRRMGGHRFSCTHS
jgi:hypothetical protein